MDIYEHSDSYFHCALQHSDPRETSGAHLEKMFSPAPKNVLLNTAPDVVMCLLLIRKHKQTMPEI